MACGHAAGLRTRTRGGPVQGEHQLQRGVRIFAVSEPTITEVLPRAMLRRLPVLVVVACLLAAARSGGIPLQGRGFAAQVEAFSEPGGYFDTDNLISNERSYLQVLPDLERPGVHGGAYVGVGPDQNFSYIARIRPPIAFIVDIRRDNLLLHLYSEV